MVARADSDADRDAVPDADALSDFEASSDFFGVRFSFFSWSRNSRSAIATDRFDAKLLLHLKKENKNSIDNSYFFYFRTKASVYWSFKLQRERIFFKHFLPVEKLYTALEPILRLLNLLLQRQRCIWLDRFHIGEKYFFFSKNALSN
jgi:hypothetical protein